MAQQRVPYARNKIQPTWMSQQLTEYALADIDISPLIARLTHLIEIFGGIQYAFDMEWKIRLYVVEVLNFALLGNNLKTEKLKQSAKISFKTYNENNGLKIDGEKALEQFAARVQPDLTVLTYDNRHCLY